MFSNYLILLIEKLHFIRVIIARFFAILFRKVKKIELLYLNYDTKYLFDKSFIIINYKFNNALYYQFDGQRTLEKQIKIFNLKTINSEIDFIVHGFFQKKIYKLKFEPELTLNTESFKTNLYNLKLQLVEQIIPKLVQPNVICQLDKPFITSSKIKITNKPITFKNHPFNLNDFI